MKEVREGLILAMTHRERFSKNIHIALYNRDDKLDKYIAILDEFDNTVKIVLAVSISYIRSLLLFT